MSKLFIVVVGDIGSNAVSAAEEFSSEAGEIIETLYIDVDVWLSRGDWLKCVKLGAAANDDSIPVWGPKGSPAVLEVDTTGYLQDALRQDDFASCLQGFLTDRLVVTPGDDEDAEYQRDVFAVVVEDYVLAERGSKTMVVDNLLSHKRDFPDGIGFPTHAFIVHQDETFEVKPLASVYA